MILKTVGGVLIHGTRVREHFYLKNKKMDISYQHHLQFIQDLQPPCVGPAVCCGDLAGYPNAQLRPGGLPRHHQPWAGSGAGAQSLSFWQLLLCSAHAIVHSEVAMQSCAIAGASAGDAACWGLRQ